jgi:hypothetical protein
MILGDLFKTGMMNRCQTLPSPSPTPTPSLGEENVGRGDGVGWGGAVHLSTSRAMISSRITVPVRVKTAINRT